MKLPERQHATVAEIYRHHERAAEDQRRPHLGASLAGHPCARHLWFAFRWARPQVFQGRILRLFDTGRREEARLLDELRAIGCEVSTGPAPGQQWSFTAHAGHFGASLDGAVRGLPEAPRTWHVFEAKTHKADSFADLVKKHVRASKPVHWAQMQIYMYLSGIKRALYLAVCKNTDHIHSERVELDEAEAIRLLERAGGVIFSAEPPPRISEDAAWYECKLCPYHALCHGEAAPEVSCRTCVHATPERVGEARWSCARHRTDLTLEAQKAACPEHRHFPVLLERFAELVDADNEANRVRYRNRLTGAEFGQPEYASSEITAAQDKRQLGEATVEAFKREFPGARVVA